MEQLQNIKRVEVRSSLKKEVMDRIKNETREKDTPAYLKWVAAAALIVNMIAVAQYIQQEDSSQNSYELFSTETTINY